MVTSNEVMYSARSHLSSKGTPRRKVKKRPPQDEQCKLQRWSSNASLLPSPLWSPGEGSLQSLSPFQEKLKVVLGGDVALYCSKGKTSKREKHSCATPPMLKVRNEDEKVSEWVTHVPPLTLNANHIVRGQSPLGVGHSKKKRTSSLPPAPPPLPAQPFNRKPTRSRSPSPCTLAHRRRAYPVNWTDQNGNAIPQKKPTEPTRGRAAAPARKQRSFTPPGRWKV